METYALWFIMALVLLGLEMATGTFYMLVLAIAAAIGGLVALAGLVPEAQMTLAAAAAVAGAAVVRRIRKVRPGASAGFDIGQPVRIVSWNEDGRIRVQYRGAEWDAEPESADTPRSGTLYIKALHGSRLVLTPHKPKS